MAPAPNPFREAEVMTLTAEERAAIAGAIYCAVHPNFTIAWTIECEEVRHHYDVLADAALTAIEPLIAARIAKAVAAEREACAATVDRCSERVTNLMVWAWDDGKTEEFIDHSNTREECLELASAIRARKDGT